MISPSRHRLGLWAVLLVLGCTVTRRNDEPAPSTASAAPPPLETVRPIEPAGAVRPVAVAVAPPVSSEPRCLEQPPQDFLLRKGQIAKIGAPKEERLAIEAARRRSIDYRTRTYGRFPGVGSSADNRHPPRFYAKLTKFMGLPVVLHAKVVPALSCVEAALARECAAFKYVPRRLGGLRDENTFKDYEVSNHLYGIAIDIDPERNPCCHCVGKWSEHKACARRVESPFERMEMPRCWVEVFERFGFHWLGHDELEDTMHFEFLGDPDRIMSTGGEIP